MFIYTLLFVVTNHLIAVIMSLMGAIIRRQLQFDVCYNDLQYKPRLGGFLKPWLSFSSIVNQIFLVHVSYKNSIDKKVDPSRPTN